MGRIRNIQTGSNLLDGRGAEEKFDRADTTAYLPGICEFPDQCPIAPNPSRSQFIRSDAVEKGPQGERSVCVRFAAWVAQSDK